jgi:hypothetical protein
MEPKIWGKYVWTSIHIIALGYPDDPTEEEKENYKRFYNDFWKVIPCNSCADNYKKHLQELPINDHLKDSASLFKWTVDLHNIVNKELGQKQVTFEEARESFARLARGEKGVLGGSIDKKWEKLAMNLTSIVLIILFVGLVYWTLKKSKK